MARTERVLTMIDRDNDARRRHAERVLHALENRADDREAFADTLRDVAAEGRNQVEIAAWLGTTRQNVNNIIKGRR
ncbi:hypothetical protein [Actinotalea sp. JY-7876]|uniref:hypothetical protein n=1 Tax=Actinotalea sp. JY-7876 TaxID=2758442 RepID=UPI0015F586FF|nr:hypothetical protein [Actinotalea sp. JY-7876]